MATRQWDNLVRYVRRLLGPGESAVLTDRQLLHCFAETRDESAFGQLVERHGPMVLGVCRRLLHDSQEAEDAFQATFWALARKAGSISWQDSIGSWLYTVACRVAVKSRTRSARRRQIDREAAVMRSEPAPTTDTDAELRALLDVELQRLPEKYRAPLVLCYLEGQTNEEAALRLGWPKGTVQGRLARGRDVLRGRLLRRGVALAGVGLALLETPPAPAALPQSMIQTTIRYAIDPGASTASVVSLAEGVLRSMWLTKMKISALVLFGAVLLGTGAFILGTPGGGGQPLVGAPLPKVERAAPSAEPMPFPDGVIDPERRTAFVTTPKGGIQAIRLEDGKVLWTNDTSSAEPWLVVGDRLIARGERILVLATRQDGKVVRECDVLPWPKVEVAAPCTLAFELSGPRVIDGALQVSWHIRAELTPLGRRRDPNALQIWQAFNEKAPSGYFKVDLETGKAEVRSEPIARELPAGPEIPAKLMEVKQKFEAQHPNSPMAVFQNRLVGVSLDLEMVGKEYMKTAVLRTWDLKTGEAAAPVELLKDKATNVADIAITQDRRHVAVVLGNSVATYSLETGRRLGLGGDREAFVEGGRAYFVKSTDDPSAIVLKAIDLETNKLVWSQPIKSRYRRPLPPRS